MEHILKCHEIVKTDFVRGENCYLYDTQGKQYVDFESGCWAAALGYSHPAINRVMESQIKQVMHLGTRTPNFLAEETAIEILNLIGMQDGKCLFLSSGSEAVEFAVQTAKRVTGKQVMLTFTASYLAAYGSAGRKSPNEWHVFDWNTWTPEHSGESLKAVSFEQLGGFAFEPGGSGSGFVKFPPQPLVHEFAQRITQAGGVLIANEITTGMGRTGKWFGFQHYDFQPDIVALGKGLGNGYPVSVVAMKRDIAEKMEQSGLYYAQSHQNDPLGVVVAKEVIRIMRQENWIERGNAMGAYFLEGLQRLAGKYAIVKEARGRGMLIGLEFRPHDRFSAKSAYYALLEKGFLTGYSAAGNLLRFDPALTIDKENVTRLLDCLDELLKTVE